MHACVFASSVVLVDKQVAGAAVLEWTSVGLMGGCIRGQELETLAGRY